METEVLKIFDNNRKEIGVATREEVHRLGHWHETFHCWFIGKEEEKDYIYMQLRSPLKKDYPNLYDITAAGHLLAHETVEDGVREIEEELGIFIPLEDLIPLGIIEYWDEKESFIDKELAHVFLYHFKGTLDDFALQKEEVAGIVKAKLDEFMSLWLGERESITIKGFQIDSDGKKQTIEDSIQKTDFVPHQLSYFQRLIKQIDSNS